MDKKTSKSETMKLIARGLGSFTPWIVGPLAISLVVGKLLDTHLDIYPWGTILASFVGFAVTLTGVAKSAFKMMEEQIGDSEDEQTNDKNISK